ncbi:MAG TPA: amidohydrolase family protein [Archangium sp.]|jgi:beta-aspartyl-dipeptidase (metallo-type)|uniref:amidohydrolase family protein n=1 Tax=Archangium sp. TaxID=1872627 RepID=UPI002ED9C1BE
MLTLIRDGVLHTPAPAGVQSVLLVGELIAHVGPVDEARLTSLEVPCEVVDASGCLVVPGLVDPHEHLIGAGGEKGFSTRMHEVTLEQLLLAGVTTVVGCLGTDSVTRHLGALVGKARQLTEGGVSAFLYTGGFHLPPRTLTGSVTEDLVLIDCVLGVGELAIADARSTQNSVAELARVVAEAMVGGTLSGKAGVTHFHTGPGRARMSQLHQLLDEYEVRPECLYATHANRTEALMDDAIALAHRGAYIDLDTVDGGLGRWIRYYLEHGGLPERLTVSSDAHTAGAEPAQLHRELVACVREHGLTLETVLPFFTANPAAALKLRRKGRLAPGQDADLVLLDARTLDIRHVFTRGRRRVGDGKLLVAPEGRGA